MPDETKKIHIDLDESDARILACGLSMALQVIQDQNVMIYGPFILNDQTNEAVASFIGLMSGHLRFSETKAAFERGESLSTKINENTQRFSKLIEGVLKQTDAKMYEHLITMRDANRG